MSKKNVLENGLIRLTNPDSIAYAERMRRLLEEEPSMTLEELRAQTPKLVRHSVNATKIKGRFLQHLRTEVSWGKYFNHE